MYDISCVAMKSQSPLLVVAFLAPIHGASPVHTGGSSTLLLERNNKCAPLCDCTGTIWSYGDNSDSVNTAFICGLGPNILPAKMPLSGLLTDYDRAIWSVLMPRLIV